MLYFLFFAGIVCGMILSTILLQRAEAVKIPVYGCGMFFCFYIISSGVLIFGDSFTIIKALVITLIAEVVLSIFAGTVIGKRIIKISFSPVITIAAIILAVLFAYISSINKSGIYPAGQDQGLYQFKTFLYMSGNYDNINSFDEYNLLDDDSDRYNYLMKINGMVGVNLVNHPVPDKPADAGEDYVIPMEEVNLYSEGATDYVLHGLASLPAILALWGDLFGVTHIYDVLTLFYVVSILGVLIICDNLGMKKYTSVTAAVLTGLCPIVLWSSQVTLPEICLGMIITFFFGIVSENRKKKLYGWSAIPVAAFCFYHILILSMLPLFLAVYFIIYLYTKNKSSLVAMTISVIAFICGINMMNTYNEMYVRDNVWPIIRITKFLVNYDNYMTVLMVVPVCLLAAVFVIHFILKKTGLKRKIYKSLRKANRKNVRITRIIVSVIFIIMTVAAVIMYNKTVPVGDLPASRFTLFGIESMTGYLLFPAAIIFSVACIRDYIPDYRKTVLIFTMIYFVLAYAIAIIPNIYYYYYYFRYFEPYMMIVIILGLLLLEKAGPALTVPAGAVMAGVIIYQSNMLYTEQDLTYADIEVVNSIASCVGSHDVVLMRDEGYTVSDLYMISIKALTGATVMFYDLDHPDKQMEMLGGMYDNVFYLAYDYGYGDIEGTPWKHVYQEEFHCSNYNGFTYKYPAYPGAVIDWDTSLGLYIYTGYSN